MPQALRHERIAVSVFGALFAAAMLVLAIAFPEPTDFQYRVFRMIFAVSAAGVAAFLPRALDVEMHHVLRAGVIIAVFTLLYSFSPARLIYQNEVPKPGQELVFTTDSAKLTPDHSLLLYLTLRNQHPYDILRLTGVRIHELKRIPTEYDCCPETKSEFDFKIAAIADSTITPDTPRGKPNEIPPLSSQSFVAKATLVNGPADNNPVVWFGLDVHYSMAEGDVHLARSDQVYLANANDVTLPVAFHPSDLSMFPERLDFLLLDEEISQGWFMGKASDGQ